MENTDQKLIEDLIQLLKRHGLIGFVGTFMSDVAGRSPCTTVRLVYPGYDETRFKEVERQLSATVDIVFNATQVSKEQGYMIDPDVLGQ